MGRHALLPHHQVRSLVQLYHKISLLSRYREIAAYLSRPDIRSQLGVDPAVPANFSNVNEDFLATLWANGDRMFPAYDYVAALLERGVRALIYVGVNDLLCNWVRIVSLDQSIERTSHSDGTYSDWPRAYDTPDGVEWTEAFPRAALEGVDR